MGDLIVLNVLERKFWVEALHHDNLTTERQSAHAIAEGGGVIERRGRQINGIDTKTKELLIHVS